MELKIGILLPRSDMYPTLALDFLNGLKLAMNMDEVNSLNPKYIIESIGNATETQLIKTAEKFILQEDVDITISFCGNLLLDQLVNLFNGYKKPLIHVDLGGNVLLKAQISPYVIHHSLSLCEGAYASAIYAAKHFGKKAAMISSAYDGGYQITGSFDKGFAENGGEYRFISVSPMDYKSDSLEDLIKKIETEKPDFIVSTFSYKEGNRILEAFGKASFNGNIPILATPIMTDTSIVTENYGVKNIRSIASWSFDEETETMKKFISLYSERSNQHPNVFSLLGYECGLIISKSTSEENKILPNIGAFMGSKELQTPRGKILYSDYHHSIPEKLLVREFKFNDTRYHNKVTETLDASIANNLNEKFEGQMLSGWQNPYTCT